MSLFAPVTREKSKLRMALTGVSGSGKTLSALYIAYGITGDWSKVALIDTEHERGRFYANRTDLEHETGAFLYASLIPPYSPDRYKQYVSEASDMVGPDGVVIVDSFSHAWTYEGGVMDIKETIAARPGKNSYSAWFEAGKIQTNLTDSILSAECHTIVTMRSKMDYVMEENERGKQTPKKIGLAPVQRDDTEYEFDVVLDLARDHTAYASKDTTFLDKYLAIITPDLGRQLKTWLDEGQDPETILCEDCGNPIKRYMKLSPKDFAQVTQDKYNKKLCQTCSRKAKKEKEARELAESTAAASGRATAAEGVGKWENAPQ